MNCVCASSSAAYVADSGQRLVLCRGYAGWGMDAANATALAAAAYLSNNVGIGTCYFMLYDAGATVRTIP